MEEKFKDVLKVPVAKRTREILRAFKLRASHRLGQNFLTDQAVVDDIVSAAEIEPGERVLEIGPGIGALSAGLLEAGAAVTAVELDKKLPDVLSETLRGYDNFTLVQGDILKVNLEEIMGGERYKVVANLPYYITTPILLTLLERKLPIIKIVTMIQKEVAERIVAEPGGKDYGAVTLAFNYYTKARVYREVPPASFYPAPEVTSAVLAADVLDAPAVDVRDEQLLFKLIRGAFNQRRKTLSNALKGAGFPKEEIAAALSKAGIDGSRRGETLSLAEFAAIADNFEGGKLCAS